MPVAAPAKRLFIGGEWIDTQETHSVYSPYNHQPIAEVAWGNKSHAEHAIHAAERAMASPLAAHARARILDDVAVALRNRKSEFARLIALEAGKPITAAALEVDRAVQTLVFSAAAARSSRGELVNLDAHPAGEGRLGLTLRIPIGIVAAITPFNFPLNLVLHKVAPAFAAGCAIVLKPADKTPLSALFLAELFVEAGVPAGWINVVVGPAQEIVDVLLQDARIAVITFTGSPEIGWSLRAKAPKKKVLLELGNATPVIVLADGDLEQAASVVSAHGFGFAGQTCISIQRVYVEQAVRDEFLEKLEAKVRQLKTGDPLDPETQVGPMITEASRDRLLSWIRDAEAEGAQVLTGGRVNSQGILEPTLLTDVDVGMAISCKEAFGPVVTVSSIRDLNEGVALANGTPYGLQAGIFTTNVAAALAAARQLHFGGVMINESPSFRADNMPYGGVKDSGNTREGPAYAFEEYTEPRLVVLKLPTN